MKTVLSGRSVTVVAALAMVCLQDVACSSAPSSGGDAAAGTDASLVGRKDGAPGKTKDGAPGTARDGASVTRDGGREPDGSPCPDGICSLDAAHVVCGEGDAAACGTGKPCATGAECQSLVCATGPSSADGGVDGGSDGGPIDCGAGQSCTCQPPTSSDGVRNDSETDVDCGGGLLPGGQPNTASDGAPVCQVGQSCLLGTDCVAGVCNDDMEAGGPPMDCPAGSTCQCQTPSPTDGVQNGGETGVDCGGATTAGSDGAPACATGSGCLVAGDCVSLLCVGAMPATSGAPPVVGVCTAASCTDGVQDGTETNVDCGGGACPGCVAGDACSVGTDCASGGCDYTFHCALAPSCVPHFGGDTCGSGEDIGPAPDGAVAHESCCTSIEVPGYTEPAYPGKAVYLDKYEITAGRMRAFIAYVSSLNGGVPDIAGYTAANRPAVNWNQGWETILPSNDGNSTGPSDVTQFTVGSPQLLYPSAAPAGSPCYPPWSIQPGTFSIYPGLENLLGPEPYFPECQGGGGGAATVSQPTGNYCQFHNFNCTNEAGAEGYGTFWFDLATSQDADPLSMGKYWSQDELDEKALNCTPFGMFAAFCAWDGGQIMSQGVFKAVTAGVTIPYQGDSAWPNCNGGTITTFDSATSCPSVYYYPYDASGQTWDNSSIIAPPGRVAGDVITMAGGAGPWHDLIGNLMEAVLLPSGAMGFQGAGIGFGDSVNCHTYQFSTPRMKNAETGARCMRFK